MPNPLSAALACGVLLCAAPAFAHEPDGLLAAPPAHAPAGQCYAHVRKAARYAPPPMPGAHWTLSPPPPGAPGPVWCLTFDAAAPPQVISLAREGWIRVRCGPRRVARTRPHSHPKRVYARRVATPPAPPPLPVSPCCLLARSAGPPPPPVVILAPPRPYSPPSPTGRWLSWPGKTLY